MISSDLVYDYLNTIKRSSGHMKLKILKTYNIKDYLLAAYDPYTMYHLTKVKPGKGTAQFTDIMWKILEELSSKRISGYSAQMIVDTLTSEMTPKSSKLFEMILNKDLRMGMGAKSINKVFPELIPTHDVMLAKLFDVRQLKLPCYGSPKIDGVRAKFRNGIFYSRNGHPYRGIDHISDQLHEIIGELDGELLVAGTTFQKGSGLIRSDDLTPDAVFHLFELPTMKAPFIERLIMMKDIQSISDYMFMVQHKILHTENEVMLYYLACRKAGYEGAVIKPIDYEYKETRSYDWMKMKNVDTVDVIVTGMYEGKGKYENQMGGVIVDFNGQPNKVGGGWSDHQRKFFWFNRNEIIDKCIEVLYMEKTDDGNMRHARFIRFREDLNNEN